METIHEYARERLRDSGESEALQRRHAEYFMAWVERFKRDIRAGGQQYTRFAWMNMENANLRAALEWSLEGTQPELGLRMIGAMWPYWWRQGQHVEWRTWVSQAERVSVDMAPAIQAGIVRAKGNLLWAFNNPVESKRVIMEALAIYRSLGDAYDIGITLVEMASASYGIADEYVDAVASCQEGIALLREADDKGGVAQGLNDLGIIARMHGDNDLAQSAYEECLVVAKEIGDKLREGIMYGSLGLVALNRGNYEQARHLLKQFGILAVEIGSMPFVLDYLAYMACAMGGGQPRNAARLIGASEALHRNLGVEVQPSGRLEYERGVALVCEQLGEETFNTLRKEGSVMSLDEAVAFAHNEADDE